MAKKSLTEADIAALAAGATLDAEGTVTQELEGAQDALQTETPAEEVTQTEVNPEPVASSDTSVQFLQSMVKDKDEALIAANVKIAKLEEKLADVEAAHAPLLAIAVKSARNMATALNGTSLLSEGMAAVQVLAEH